MILIELAQQAGLKPYKASNTQGGEYKSACPKCGGKDRFYIQPYKQMKLCVGYYRCRQCDYHGDAIQFAQDLGMDFQQAAERVNATLSHQPIFRKQYLKKTFKATVINATSDLWQIKAQEFIAWVHNNILNQPKILEQLKQRGLPIEAIHKYKIGWNPQELWIDKSDWGITPDNKKLWIPRGIVIPSLDNSGNIQRIKIRRVEWNKQDTIGKYIILSGSMNGLSIIGNTKHDLMIVVESELDAYALHFAVSDYAFVIAVGSNSKNPDNIVHFLAPKKTILICHDNDDAGQLMLKKWKQLYAHAQSYSTPLGKDIGEAVEQGLRIRPWLLQFRWDKTTDQELIDYVLKYIDDRTVTKRTYDAWEKEIFLGPDSPRAKIGELQKGLKLIQQLTTQSKTN
ncbi:MAG TPA: toprim domain-containing protein [Candidatus Dependentiae bacterium]|nr:toprim domain-containing protein [Candidatus Dependentiae bacterium]HRQ63198.1 toprim domain-containing protein [Candidatus Dependentiae bacterium]